MSTPSKPLVIRERLSEVRYEIRGELARRARELEAQGRKLIKLNIGNPGNFGFRAPEHLQRAIADDMGRTDPYTHQQGLPVAREAIAAAYARRGAPDAVADRVFLGNGVSELIDLSLRALLNPGDEVLVPSPDYPLWSASTILNDGRPVYYRCAPENGFQPDPSEIETLVSSRTRAIVLINPNNPAGASYPRELLEKIVAIARKHNLLLLVDEIYDQILYDGAQFQPVAPLAGDHPCLTFSGLSKVHRACGWRVGWMLLSGAGERLGEFRAALDLLSALRLCANVPGQWAVQTALGGHQSIDELVKEGGRLRVQRDVAWELINAIPGVSCVKPKAALYMFPRLDPEIYPIKDDQEFFLEVLQETKVMLVQGTGFNWPNPDHFRIVFLPHEPDLREAINRLATFLAKYRQRHGTDKLLNKPAAKSKPKADAAV